jgi:hypothetical protein
VYAFDVHKQHIKLLCLDRIKLKELICSSIYIPLAGYLRASGPKGRDSFLAATCALREQKPETNAQ